MNTHYPHVTTRLALMSAVLGCVSEMGDIFTDSSEYDEHVTAAKTLIRVSQRLGTSLTPIASGSLHASGSNQLLADQVGIAGDGRLYMLDGSDMIEPCDDHCDSSGFYNIHIYIDDTTHRYAVKTVNGVLMIEEINWLLDIVIQVIDKD